MGFCRNLIVFSHTKLASIIIAGIMMLWAVIAIGPNESLFYRGLASHNMENEWGSIMFCNGFLLALWSFYPWRAGRHVSLALACFTMMSLGGFFFLQGLFTPVTVTLPFLGFMSLITLIVETTWKPRRGND